MSKYLTADITVSANCFRMSQVDNLCSQGVTVIVK